MLSEPPSEREMRHRAAVARSLQWAEDAARRGDYADALAWLRAVEAVGDELPQVFLAKRDAWMSAAQEGDPAG